MAKRSIFLYFLHFLQKTIFLRKNELRNFFSSKGDEYAHILQNIDFYCKKYDFFKYSKKTHPECIYTDPQSRFLLKKTGFF